MQSYHGVLKQFWRFM